MLLPELLLSNRINLLEYKTGIDSIRECQDKTHYRAYPHKVIYQYNSRGFRDREWPDDLQSANDKFNILNIEND